MTDRIRVIDASGRPVEGAFLRRTDDPGCFAVSDRDGWLALSLDATSRSASTAWHLGAPDARFLLVDGASLLQTRRLVLPRAPMTIVEGVVVDLSGEPIEGASIHWRHQRRETFSAADGSFRFEGVAVDASARLEVGMPGYLNASVDIPSRRAIEQALGNYRADASVEVRRIRLLRPSVVVGRVVTPRGDAPSAYGAALCHGDDDATPVSDDGRFELRDVPPGPSGLCIVHDGTTVARSEIHVTGSGSPVDMGSIVVDSFGIEVSGRIIDQDGDPVADASIYLDHAPHGRLPRPATDGEPRYPMHATSSPDGSFSIAGLAAADELTLGVAAEGYSQRSIVVDVEDPYIEVEIVRLLQLDVEVVSAADGSSLPAAIIFVDPGWSAEHSTNERGKSLLGRTTLTTDEEGRAVLDLHPSGAPSLTVGHPTYVNTTITLTEEDLDSTSLRIELDEGASVSGRVVSQLGEPVSGVAIRSQLPPELRPPTMFPADMSSTDDEGRFEITGLPPGLVRLELIAPAHGRQVRELDLPPGASDVEVQLDALPTFSLSGEARFEDGEPARNLMIVATHRTVSSGQAVMIDSSGAFYFEDLVAGEYEIGIQSAGPSGPRRFRLLEGSTLTLDREMAPWTVVVQAPASQP